MSGPASLPSYEEISSIGSALWLLLFPGSPLYLYSRTEDENNIFPSFGDTAYLAYRINEATVTEKPSGKSLEGTFHP